jgi:hypothetical protein
MSSAGREDLLGGSMRSHCDLTGLIKFLARDDWKSSFEAIMDEHFGPAMQAFDIEYKSIGAALGSGWDTTLWGGVRGLSRPAIRTERAQLR